MHEAKLPAARARRDLGHRHAAARVPARRRPAPTPACFLISSYSGEEPRQCRLGEDLTIGELAETMAEVVGFRASSPSTRRKPDGTPRKLLDRRD